MRKKVLYREDMHCVTKWRCPYKNCGHQNAEYETEPDWLEEVKCKKCKKNIKVKSAFD